MGRTPSSLEKPPMAGVNNTPQDQQCTQKVAGIPVADISVADISAVRWAQVKQSSALTVGSIKLDNSLILFKNTNCPCSSKRQSAVKHL